MSDNAFHEKAGRSQVGSFVFSLDKVFLPAESATVATLPSALFKERFVALGASWVFSFQPVLPPVWRPRLISKDEVGPGVMRSHRNSALGFAFILIFTLS
jgi:hypothetical protein